jgi:tetratricopeptide (TPR) repeat protein
MKFTLWPLILLVSLLAGCAGQPTGNSANSTFTPAANLDLDSYEGFSEALEQSMAAGDSSLFIDRLDTYQFARHSLSSMGLGAANRSTTRKYAGTLQKIVNQRFGEIFSGVESARFLRLLPVEPAHPEATVALIRLTPEDGGISYWKVYLQKTKGRVSIIDWLNYSLGDTASHAIGDFALQVGTAIKSPESKDSKAVMAYLDAAQNNDLEKLVGAYDQLPTSLKTNALLMNSYQEAAGQVSEEANKAARSRLAPAYRKKDTYALLLVDYYIETEDYQKAHHAVDKAVTLLGADAGLDSLHAGISLTAGDYKQTIAYARDGIERERSYLGNYWTLLDALVYTKNYADAVMVLDIIEDGFGYEFDAQLLAEVEGYEMFTRSSQFKGWKSASSE